MSNDVGDSGDSNGITDRDAWNFFLNGPREVFVCEVCGREAHRGNPPDLPGAFYAEVDLEPCIICDECDEKYDWVTIQYRIRTHRRGAHRSFLGRALDSVGNFLHPITSRIPVPLSVHAVPPEKRNSLLVEQSVFVGRLGLVIALSGLLLIGIATFTTITGALFVTPETGLEWLSETITVYREWATLLLGRPDVIIAILGVAYFLHLVEFQQHVGKTELQKGRSRPRWHYLALFAGGGLVGWGVWMASQRELLSASFLPVGVITWSASTLFIIYFLHNAILEDRWEYGLRIHPPTWKFLAQYAFAMMVYDGVVGLPGGDRVSTIVALVPPAVGILYATRRHLAFTARWTAISHQFEPVTAGFRDLLQWSSRFVPSTNQKIRYTSQFDEADSFEWQSREPVGRETELRRAEEWARYLESELHDREGQLQDLEAKLAWVGEKLENSRSKSTLSTTKSTSERDSLLSDLFDIRDNFRRAMEAESIIEDSSASGLSEGIELIDRQIMAILKREGVEEIDTDGPADPTKHRIVKTVSTAAYEPNEIIDVYRLGYRVDDHVLREAHVVVAEEPVEDRGDDESDPDDVDEQPDAEESS